LAAKTYESCFTNVKALPWESLPRINQIDKAKIIGLEPSLPPTKMYDSLDGTMPVLWTERKPVTFWNEIIFCLDAKLVVDMSLGSGVVGRAAMKAGITYVAACRNDVHASWLSDIHLGPRCVHLHLRRAAMKAGITYVAACRRSSGVEYIIIMRVLSTTCATAGARVYQQYADCIRQIIGRGTRTAQCSSQRGLWGLMCV